ncbi:MAG: magnesium chelatase [Pirellulaceae bacterium]|nr:MAG: magnesium chelatase [Pirellulaceae bacterium]GIW96223.1 MAG: magnesium chelatase [Pirellulaceae bacterium]
MPSDLHRLVQQLEDNMCRVVLGKRHVVRMSIACLLAGEHILLEDVPGVGKTLLGKALARSVRGKFCRIQFTPDLLPSDIVGSSVFHANTSEFVFNPGPIFAHLVLADEINRAPPRTQSALLEAMSDRQVSVDGRSHALPEPFMVIATQNPFEFEGTYALPESQLDRFLFRISIGYPDRDNERQVLISHRQGEPVEWLEPVLTCEAVCQVQREVRNVEVESSVNEYLLDIVEATRNSDELQVGASTRAAISLYRACQAWAYIEGRDYVVPDDVKQLAVPVLGHRVLPHTYMQGTARREMVENIIERLVNAIPVPV